MSTYKKKFNPYTGNFTLVLDSALLKIKGSVDTTNDLPLTGNSENDCYIVKADDNLYTWNSPLSSGTIDKWVAVGSVSSIDWTAVNNRPTSSVGDIDDAVTKKHTQNTDIKLDEGGPNEKLANDLIISRADNDWKKVTEIQYNPVTDKIKFLYET